MHIYRFFDCNNKTGVEYREYDLKGEDYRTLFEICFRYSGFMSFMNCTADNEFLKAIEEYRIPKPGNIKSDNSLYGKPFLDDDEIGLQFFRTDNKLMNILLSHTRSIFEWIDGWGFENPENPVFYRKDGSIFFSSLIHEGEITLTVNDNEDVSDIVSKEGWKSISDFNDHGYGN